MVNLSKRKFLKTAGLATAGLAVGSKVITGIAQNQVPGGGLSEQERAQRQAQQAAARAQQTTLKDPVTAKGKIAGKEFSRLILGGNPIGGWLHSRDLNYVGDLANAYLTDDKKMQIFQMAENCGVDTILGHPVMIEVLGKYWSRGIGKMKWISDCGGSADFATAAQVSIDGGCSGGYCQGENADRYVRRGDFNSIEKGLEVLRKAGLPAGIGGHDINTLKACVANGLIPDFWMKTTHHHNYWSARPGEPERDNIYCRDPEETIKFFETRKEPYIAFKVLAAGAIPPADGIRFGLEAAGGDFICLGMFDFNMIQDVNIFNEVLANLGNRKRPWCA